MLGFIILRHVNSKEIGEYWKQSYAAVRKWYPSCPIMIIDDNSKQEYIDHGYEASLINTTIINSEFHGRGELLPYYYYLKHPFCDTVCIIHDSVFVNTYIDFENVKTYEFLWNFYGHKSNNPALETALINKLAKNTEILSLYNSYEWAGCFGVMTVITHSFLSMVNANHDLSRLIEHIKCRKDRMALERVMAVTLQTYAPMQTRFGSIQRYCPWGVSYNQIDKYRHLPFIKVWSGR